MRRSTNSEEGFSLVEVLCALAVAAIALVALLRGLGSSQTAASYLDAHLGARIIAQSIIEDERQAINTAPDVRSGNSGAYRWRLTIEPAAVVLPERLPAAFRLYKLEVEVNWSPRGSFKLDTLKLGQ